MTISGLQKMTLLDYPGQVACTVFLSGCNFRCPFCHNSELLTGGGEELMTRQEFLDFLKSRRGLLDAVCVSGGEPTLQRELPEFLADIKKLGYLVKLDTNGCRPRVLERLLDEKLVDYVAMDVKNGPSLYGATVGLKDPNLADLEQSLRLLFSGRVDHELRTTVVEELHTGESIEELGRWLQHLAAPGKPRRLFLQCFVDRQSVLQSGLHAPSEEKLARYAALLAPYIEEVSVRGV